MPCWQEHLALTCPHNIHVFLGALRDRIFPSLDELLLFLWSQQYNRPSWEPRPCLSGGSGLQRLNPTCLTLPFDSQDYCLTVAGEKAEQPSTKGKKSIEFALQHVLTENQVKETETGERALLTLEVVSRQQSLGHRNNNDSGEDFSSHVFLTCILSMLSIIHNPAVNVTALWFSYFKKLA